MHIQILAWFLNVKVAILSVCSAFPLLSGYRNCWQIFMELIICEEVSVKLQEVLKDS